MYFFAWKLFKVRREIKDYWLAALKAGTHKRGTKLLRTLEDRHCFLGVLADLSVKYAGVTQTQDEISYLYDGFRECLPTKTIEWAMMKNPHAYSPQVGKSITDLNDKGIPWEDLTQILEKHWESL